MSEKNRRKDRRNLTVSKVRNDLIRAFAAFRKRTVAELTAAWDKANPQERTEMEREMRRLLKEKGGPGADRAYVPGLELDHESRIEVGLPSHLNRYVHEGQISLRAHTEARKLGLPSPVAPAYGERSGYVPEAADTGSAFSKAFRRLTGGR